MSSSESRHCNGATDGERSILDTDAYKITMMLAVLRHYPETRVRYRFTNRTPAMRFNRAAFEYIQAAIQRLATVRLQPDEREWLKSNYPIFTQTFLDQLEAFRFQPAEQIDLRFESDDGEWGYVALDIKGKWAETILYEVPVMAIISEAYFLHVDTNWDQTGQLELARTKAKRLTDAGIVFSEFGTRRRRSYRAHDLVMRGLVEGAKAAREAGGKGALMGTSNVHFAHKYGLKAIGTIAHEWIMGTAALNGYPGSNGLAMNKWENCYPDNSLSIALTDTFSSKPFFEDFASDPERAKRWRGLRQDSGDPKVFTREAKRVYESLGIDPKTKMIVYSDGLNIETCIDLKQFADHEGIGCSFGTSPTARRTTLGLRLTYADFVRTSTPSREGDGASGEGPARSGEASKALNIVIKLYEIDGKPCVKISDELTKTMGEPEAVRLVKQRFGLP